MQILARGERAIDEGAGDPEEHCGGDGGQDRGSGRNTGDKGRKREKIAGNARVQR